MSYFRKPLFFFLLFITCFGWFIHFTGGYDTEWKGKDYKLFQRGVTINFPNDDSTTTFWIVGDRTDVHVKPPYQCAEFQVLNGKRITYGIRQRENHLEYELYSAKRQQALVRFRVKKPLKYAPNC